MKDKLKFLTQQSLNKKIKTKWFKAVNILLLCLLLVIANVDRIVTFFGGDFESEIKVYVKDEIGGYEMFKTTFENSLNILGEAKNYKILPSEKSVEDFKKDSKENTEDILIQLLPDSKTI